MAQQQIGINQSPSAPNQLAANALRRQGVLAEPATFWQKLKHGWSAYWKVVLNWGNDDTYWIKAPKFEGGSASCGGTSSGSSPIVWGSASAGYNADAAYRNDNVVNNNWYTQQNPMLPK